MGEGAAGVRVGYGVDVGGRGFAGGVVVVVVVGVRFEVF